MSAPRTQLIDDEGELIIPRAPAEAHATNSDIRSWDKTDTLAGWEDIIRNLTINASVKLALIILAVPVTLIWGLQMQGYSLMALFLIGEVLVGYGIWQERQSQVRPYRNLIAQTKQHKEKF
jgi:hypothetical protein